MSNDKIDVVKKTGIYEDTGGYKASATFNDDGEIVALVEQKNPNALTFADLCKQTAESGRVVSHANH